jgi:RNA-directed DNA polymerase
MRRFVLGWKKLGLEERLGTCIVTYADDLVILCRRVSAEAALTRMRELMEKLKLTVNEDKTRICRVPEGSFDFLGYTFGRPIWACGRPRKASSAWWRLSTR